MNCQSAVYVEAYSEITWAHTLQAGDRVIVIADDRDIAARRATVDAVRGLHTVIVDGTRFDARSTYAVDGRGWIVPYTDDVWAEVCAAVQVVSEGGAL